MFKITDNKTKNIMEAYDERNNLVGKAIVSPFMESDICEKPRLNIYFDIKVEDFEDKLKLKDQLLDEVIRRSRIIKEEHKDIDVRVYHCCFSDNKKDIEYYSSKKGFKYDEGMYIVRKFISEESFQINDIVDIEFTYLELIDKDEIAQLVEKQNKVFTYGYSPEDLKDISNEHQWFSIAAKHNGEIIGNIIIVVKEDETGAKYGWVEDLFVSKEYRKYGIGKNLVLRALVDLKALNIKESRLEVWSTNKRALNLYNSIGYKFFKETESSIGMLL